MAEINGAHMSTKRRLPNILYVLSEASWTDWLLPFLHGPNFISDISIWENGAPIPIKLRSRRFDAAILLSHHKTLLRDSNFAHDKDGIFAQPSAVSALAHDKKKMARHALNVPGLKAIPGLSSACVRDWLTKHPRVALVAKATDGTEGIGSRIISTIEQWRSFIDQADVSSYLLQPFLHGDEYSVNVVTDGSHTEVYYPVSKGPTSLEGVHPCKRIRRFPPVVDSETLAHRLMHLARDYVREIGACGIVELEFINCGDDIYLLEINPRISATLRMSIAASSRNALVTLAHYAVGEPLHDGIVPTSGFALECPLPKNVQDSTLAKLARLDSVHISSRVTITAGSRDALQALSLDVASLLGQQMSQN